MDVAHQLQNIAVGIDKNRFISSAKQSSVATMAKVVFLGINTVEMAHAAR